MQDRLKKAGLLLLIAGAMIGVIYIVSYYYPREDDVRLADRVRLDAEKELSVLKYQLSEQSRITDSLQAAHDELKYVYNIKIQQLGEIEIRYHNLRLDLATMDKESRFDYFKKWLSEGDALGQ
jgi:hypothetical protein